MELEFDGKKARYQVQTYSRDYILQSVRLPATPAAGDSRPRRSAACDRLGKSLGLNREVQLDDQAFDDAAYLGVGGAGRGGAAGLWERPRCVRGCWSCCASAIASISPTTASARRASVAIYSSFEAGELPYILQALEAIEAALPRYIAVGDGGGAAAITARRCGRFVAPSALGLCSFPFLRSCIRRWTTWIRYGSSASG